MCGISAWLGDDAVNLTYQLLLEIQHRGHDSAGISYLLNGRFVRVGGPGFVWKAIDFSKLDERAPLALGHVRYSTSGLYGELYQPVIGRRGLIALAFNGNIINYKEIGKEIVGSNKYDWDAKALVDVVEEIYLDEGNLADAIREASTIIKGSFSIVASSVKGELVASRDPRGIRPLAYSIGDRYFAVASETAALSTLGLEWKELRRGEIIYCNEPGSCEKTGLRGVLEPMPCAFEFIYFLRPDSYFEGVNAHEARKRMGEKLAEKDFVKADVVSPVPDSGRSAAIGYAMKSGLPFDEIIYRNRFSGRAFISAPSIRRKVLLKKFHVISNNVRGKRIILVDDSIVRGDTSRHIVSLLRKAGAKEVHIRSAAPPIRYPCFFGIDMPTRKELVAHNRSIEEIRKYIGADTLIYNTVKDLEASVGMSLCLGCFTALYPISVNINDLEILFSVGRR